MKIFGALTSLSWMIIALISAALALIAVKYFMPISTLAQVLNPQFVDILYIQKLNVKLSMNPLIAGALIGGGASLLGGLFGNRSADKRQSADAALQREFAQKGIQWKAADAKAAGIHPLAALGANTHSYSPSYVGDNGAGSSISQAGQDIGRAVSATANDKQRATALLMANEQIKGQRIENEMAALQLASEKMRLQAQQNPPMPVITNAEPKIQVLPKKRTTATSVENPHIEAGEVSDVAYSRTATGLAVIPSTDVKQQIEDQFIPETAWAIRNLVSPNFGSKSTKPSKEHLKYFPGAIDFDWNKSKQEWRPVYGAGIRPKNKKQSHADLLMQNIQNFNSRTYNNTSGRR